MGTVSTRVQLTLHQKTEEYGECYARRDDVTLRDLNFSIPIKNQKNMEYLGFTFHDRVTHKLVCLSVTGLLLDKFNRSSY